MEPKLFTLTVEHYDQVFALWKRCKGIGTALVKNSLERLRNMGLSKCHIFIFKNNESGRVFWEKCGWHYREDLGIISKIIV